MATWSSYSSSTKDAMASALDWSDRRNYSVSSSTSGTEVFATGFQWSVLTRRAAPPFHARELLCCGLPNRFLPPRIRNHLLADAVHIQYLFEV